MKARGPEQELNTPHEMFVRAAFLLFLGSMTAGMVLIGVGALNRDLRLLAFGIAALAVAGLTREWLRRGGRLDAAETAFREFCSGGARPDPDSVAQLSDLVRQWHAIERKRGSRDFDPWELQAVRHDIRVILEKEPELEAFVRDRDGGVA